MTYLMCDPKRRILPVVTFVLISYLFSGELVCARPQEISSSAAPDSSNDTKDFADKVEPANSTSNERNGSIQPTVVEQSIKIYASGHNASAVADAKKTEQKLYGDISVDSGLDFGRSAIEAATKTSVTVNTLKPLSKTGVTPITATDMVAADVRTPPKVKSQIVHSHMQSLMTPGKGEAIPVVLEGNDEAALEKISSDNFKYTHSDSTPSSGLSTWILLNSDTASTTYSHHKKVQKPTSDAPSTTSAESTSDSKKKPSKSTTTTTTEKSIKSKIETVVIKKPERKPIATIQKVNQTHAKKPTTPKMEPEEIPTTTIVSLQDSKFKNKTPVVVGKVPSTNTKEVVNATTPMTFVELPFDNNTRLGTPVVTFPHVPVRRHNSTTTRKPSSTAKPTMVMISSGAPTKFASVQEYPMASTVAISSQDVSSVSTEEAQSEAITESTTKKSSTSTSGKKKKKKNKNKNKRRRPTKKPAKIQSKISEDDNSTSKLPVGMPTGSRPLSTRIYNYLAREVMPNVGVGLVGLMLTAGLAGLLLYPFGGAIPVRRNYEKPGPTYNLNDYPPVSEVDNAQPEESVLSQVLAGMSNSMNQYSREQPDVLYKTHPKYKPARFDNPNSYNHHKDIKYTTETAPVEDNKYSELGDVVSGPHESVKFTSFDISDSIKYPMDGAEPSPNYSSIDLTTSTQNEPIYHKYPASDSMKHESPVYSSLSEYASYNNPHEPMQNPVYNGETYDYKNHKNSQNSQEYKVISEMDVVTQAPENQTTTMKIKHEQPSFAALEGIPKNYRTLQTSIRFEDTPSVLPMNQDFVPSDGVFAASIEHGPRNMKLQRKKRNTSSENEIDSVLVEPADKLTESTQPPVQFISTEAIENLTTLVSTTEQEKPSTKPFDIVEMITKASEDVKQIISTTENTVELKNKSEPVVVTPQTGSVSENVSYFVPTVTNPKVEIVANSNTLCENCELSNAEEHPPAPQPFSFTVLFRKLLDFKFRIGYELIRATTDVISKYMNTVQQRMTEALRDFQRSAFRMNNDKKSTKSNVMKKRQRRHIVHGS